MVNLYTKIWMLSWPLILANISVPLLGIIDTAILGHLPSPSYLAAVSIGASLVTLILNSANFLRMSATGLASNTLTDNNIKNRLTLFKSSIFFAIFLSIAILVANPCISHFGLELMLGKSDPDQLRPLALEYTQIRLWAAPATFINFVLIGWSIAWQKPRLAIIAMTSSAVINIILDAFFIIILSMNSKGAALASVMAEYTSVIVTLLYFYRYFPELFKQSWVSLPPKASLYRLASINNDLFIRSVSLLFCFAFMNSQSAKLGAVVTAANAVLLQIIYFQSYTLDGFANATEALVGGSQQGKARKQVLKASLTLSVIAAFIICIVLTIAKPYMLTLFTHQVAVKSVIDSLIHFVILLPLVSVFCYWLDGVAVGLQASKAMRNSTLVSAFLVFVPACYLLQGLQNYGLWLAFLIFTLARSLTLAHLLFYGKNNNH